jgi:hypothetical protein|tara:strand:+ start:687 stop:1085 length:399 start_codon:yes stop_codon:yes gene_type:complete
MKILKYFIILFFVLSITDAQDIKKDGKVVQTFTYSEALEMLKARDTQWEGKIEKADSLIASQKVVISDCENLVLELEESAEMDSVISVAKSAQIQLLKTRSEANEKLVEIVQPKWYENQYLWLIIGFVSGKI